MKPNGYSITEVMIGAGLLAFGAVVGIQVFSSQTKAVFKAQQLGEDEDLRNLIRRSIDCNATVQRERSRCTMTGSNISGYDSGGRALVSQPTNGRTFGSSNPVNVKLVCRDTGIDFAIQASVTRNGATRDLFDIPLSCTRCRGASTADPYTFSGGPHNLASTVSTLANECGIAVPNIPFRRSYDASGGGNRWTSDGTMDAATLTKICDHLGYTAYVSSTCYDGERSWRYPTGKCNWHSPNNNDLQWFDGTNWRNQHGPPKYQWTWVSTITCSGLK